METDVITKNHPRGLHQDAPCTRCMFRWNELFESNQIIIVYHLTYGYVYIYNMYERKKNNNCSIKNIFCFWCIIFSWCIMFRTRRFFFFHPNSKTDYKLFVPFVPLNVLHMKCYASSSTLNVCVSLETPPPTTFSKSASGRYECSRIVV